MGGIGETAIPNIERKTFNDNGPMDVEHDVDGDVDEEMYVYVNKQNKIRF